MMAKIALTGAHGFLGWHTRAAAQGYGASTGVIPLGKRFDLNRAIATVDGTDRLVHIAGVNRGTDEEVATGNIAFAEQLAQTLRESDSPPPIVIFANSIQAANANVYGESKKRASDILRSVSDDVNSTFVDVWLPNLFGEHGRPFYNSVVATFCHQLVNRETPRIELDRELTLLHAQDAADILLGDAREIESLTRRLTVSELLDELISIDESYAEGTIPDISEAFRRNLFNTFRSYSFAMRPEIALTRHADQRGSFFEIIRSRGGQGQSSFSTTEPSVSRGDHFHRRKIERFTVLAGTAVIGLRKLFSDEVVELEVSGNEPCAIDMPTMWTHNITNTGDGILYTNFWINEIYDSKSPDTHPEAVYL